MVLGEDKLKSFGKSVESGDGHTVRQPNHSSVVLPIPETAKNKVVITTAQREQTRFRWYHRLQKFRFVLLNKLLNLHII